MVEWHYKDAASTPENSVASGNAVDDERASGGKGSHSATGTISIPDADQTQQHAGNSETLSVSLSREPTAPQIPTRRDDEDGEKKPSVSDMSSDGDEIRQDSPISRLPEHLEHVCFEKSRNQVVWEKVLGVGCYSAGGLAGLGLCAAVPVAFILPPVGIGLGIMGGAMLLGGFLGGLWGYNKPPKSGRHGGEPVGAHLAMAWQHLEERGEFYTQYQRQCASRISDVLWRHILHLKHPRGGAFTKQRVKIQRALVHVAHKTGADLQVVLDTKKQLESLAKRAAEQRSPDWNEFDNELANIYRKKHKLKIFLPKDPDIVGEWLNQAVQDLQRSRGFEVSGKELNALQAMPKESLLKLFAVPPFNRQVVKSVRRFVLNELLTQINKRGHVDGDCFAEIERKKYIILDYFDTAECKADRAARRANKDSNADKYSDSDKSNRRIDRSNTAHSSTPSSRGSTGSSSGATELSFDTESRARKKKRRDITLDTSGPRVNKGAGKPDSVPKNSLKGGQVDKEVVLVLLNRIENTIQLMQGNGVSDDECKQTRQNLLRLVSNEYELQTEINRIKFDIMSQDLEKIKNLEKYDQLKAWEDLHRQHIDVFTVPSAQTMGDRSGVFAAHHGLSCALIIFEDLARDPDRIITNNDVHNLNNALNPQGRKPDARGNYNVVDVKNVLLNFVGQPFGVNAQHAVVKAIYTQFFEQDRLAGYALYLPDGIENRLVNTMASHEQDYNSATDDDTRLRIVRQEIAELQRAAKKGIIQKNKEGAMVKSIIQSQGLADGKENDHQQPERTVDALYVGSWMRDWRGHLADHGRWGSDAILSDLASRNEARVDDRVEANLEENAYRLVDNEVDDGGLPPPIKRRNTT